MTSSSPRSSTYCRLAATKESYGSCSGVDVPLKGEARRLYARDYRRKYRRTEKGGGYVRDYDRRKPPPREKDCPPRPNDGLCQCCGEPTERFHLDHCHETGAFRGWVCSGCNTGHGIMDSVARLEKRVAFLKRSGGRYSE
jgi:Recombination endonuclease VII